MGRGRMEEPNLGFWVLSCSSPRQLHYYGNSKASATSPKHLIGSRYFHTSQTLPYRGLRLSGNSLGRRRLLLQ